jgi:integrase
MLTRNLDGLENGPRIMAKLTKRSVEGIAPLDRDIVVWDDHLPGFGLRVKASGVRSYLVQYRNAMGQSKRMTLGRHGVLTADQARKRAQQVLAMARQGQDPVSEKAQARAAPLMSDLCDRYLADHVVLFNKPSTAKECRRIVETRIRPAMGHLKAAAVTRDEVMKLHRLMERTPRRANLTLAALSKMFNLAELWNMRPDGSNPCRHVKRYPEVQRERFLSEEELARFGTAIKEAEQTASELPGAIAAIRLLALTGCRIGEILTLRWEYVDFSNGAFRLPDAKAGARTHPVGAPALALLKALSREEGGPWVVHGKDPSQPLPASMVRRAWAHLCAKAGITEARIHDLRHTFGTYAGQTGANAFMVRDMLGQKTLAMAGRYVNRDISPLRAYSDSVGKRIAGAMAGNEAEVISIERGRKTSKK